ncbi:MAG: hypothetical protein CVU64_12100 [Deltaproteobacteria bacterium HGW-Deltaproteobacteria-21]|nr:MAG: hypothetical protein CVU64_12100 [Deltaproteobacteria bacterium HGW-Deltaproteobacteria-21]
MEILQGLRYNLRGLRIGLTSGRLLFWGMIRFVLVLLITIGLAGIVLAYRVELTELLWSKPSTLWTIWLWHVLSWLVSLLLIGFSALFSFLVSQILFSAVIMDHMSRITEFNVTGRIVQAKEMAFFTLLLHLIRQEIPRMILPLLLSFLLLVFGWITPLGPLLALASGLVSILFLSWDNTDLVPARRMMPFRERFRLLRATVLFHIGFGLPFLIPGFNLLFLSFAPIGATLYSVERDRADPQIAASRGAHAKGYE